MFNKTKNIFSAHEQISGISGKVSIFMISQKPRKTIKSFGFGNWISTDLVRKTGSSSGSGFNISVVVVMVVVVAVVVSIVIFLGVVVVLLAIIFVVVIVVVVVVVV